MSMNAKENREWCTRYMADSSGSEDGKFSHGFEALLDFQLSWNCRIAFNGHENKKLEDQCKHILNVLVNPDFNIGDRPIDPIYLCVYKQVSDTDLVIELRARKDNGEEKYIILVEDKAFTSLKEKQILYYPFVIKGIYDNNPDWVGYTFLQRVVTLQCDEVERIKSFIKQKTKEYEAKNNIKLEWEWRVLCDDDLLLKKGDTFIKTGNSLFDEFWIEDRCPVDPAPLWEKADEDIKLNRRK